MALDKLVLFTEVTDKTAAGQIESTLEHGAYIEGMFIEVTQNTISLPYPLFYFSEFCLFWALAVSLDFRALFHVLSLCSGRKI